MGELGSRVAQDLVDRGYRVTGWRRQVHAHETIPCVHGLAALPALLRNTDVLFCVLPDTPETRHLLNAERLALLPSDAALINAGRGSLIDEAALLAISTGGMRFAMLEFFATEPWLPTTPSGITRASSSRHTSPQTPSWKKPSGKSPPGCAH
jgi:Phosphoglycerate dehydrogenase and related dehydrogenases